MLAPSHRRDIPGRLRLRDGKVVHHYITSQELRDFGAWCRARRAPPVPPALPDWGLEPAASSWIRLRLPPLEPRHDDDHNAPLHHPYPREERELPNKSTDTTTVHGESSEAMVTIMIWDVHPDADCQDLRSVFEGINGILAVYHSSFTHVLLVDFVTWKAAQKARNNRFYGYWLRERPLNIASFSNDKYVLDRDSPVHSWARSGTSVCIEGFDSSLHVDEIRTMLARHFFGGSNDEERIVRVPTDLDGSSIGKAYIKYDSWCGFSEALNLNGSELEGRKLSVTECKGGSRFWDGHITPNGPGTGKRKLFNDDSDGD